MCIRDRINAVYQEMAEHYNTAIIPARVRAPKDKPNAEGTVGNISTWIIAALRDEQFFFLAELNRAIRHKLEEFNKRLFQKKEGSRLDLFRDEELPLLAPLPATSFKLVDWKQATVTTGLLRIRDFTEGKVNTCLLYTSCYCFFYCSLTLN